MRETKSEIKTFEKSKSSMDHLIFERIEIFRHEILYVDDIDQSFIVPRNREKRSICLHIYEPLESLHRLIILNKKNDNCST